MNSFQQFISIDVIQSLGWTLVHSIWQGALIAFVVGVFMIFLRKKSAKLRYLIYFSALSLILGLAVVTFLKIYNPIKVANDKVVLHENHVSNGFKLLLPANEVIDSNEQGISNWIKTTAGYLENHFPLFICLWLIGMMVFFLKFLGGLIYTQRIKYYKAYEIPEFWKKRFQVLASRMGINKTVRLAESAIVRIPVVIGHLKPVILIPLGMLSNIPPDQLEAILAHEFAHIFRKDYIFNIIQSLIEVIFFFHPVVWWLSSNIRMEREHICDDMAILHCNDSLVYAKALANIREMEFKPPVMATALANKKYLLLNRIQRMMNKPRVTTNFAEGLISVFIMIAGIAIISASASVSFGITDNGNLKPGFDHVYDIEGIIPESNFTQISYKPLEKPVSATVFIQQSDRLNGSTNISTNITGPYMNNVINSIPLIKPDSLNQKTIDSLNVLLKRAKEEAEEQLRNAVLLQEEAKQKLIEAIEQKRLAKEELRQVIREQQKQQIEAHKKAIEKFGDKIREIYLGDSLIISGGHKYDLPLNFFMFKKDSFPWKYYYFDREGNLEHSEELLEDLYEDLEYGLDSLNDFFSDFKFRHFDDCDFDFEFDFEPDDMSKIFILPEFENDEWEDKLREREIYRYKWDNSYKDFLKHQKDYHIPSHDYFMPLREHYYFLHDHKTVRIIQKELEKDGLVERGDEYVVEINSKQMLINGKKQPKEIYRKYKRLYESLEDDELKGENSFKFIK